MLVLLALAAAPLTLDDFDAGLAGRYQARGPIEVRREGSAVTAVAEGPAVFASNDGDVAWEDYAAVSLRLRATGGPAVLEWQVFHDDGPPRRKWRKIEVEPGEAWRDVVLPLEHFRDGGMAELDWEDLGPWALHFRGPATVELDRVELLPADDGDENPARLDPDELRRLAFGDGGAVHQAGHFAVVTDVPDLDADAALAQLNGLAGLVRADFPAWPEPETPVPLLVFADEAAYRAFFLAFGETFNSTIPEPASDGYTVLGVAATSRGEPRPGRVLRPVATHEPFHAYLAEAVGLASTGGNWLHESLAAHYQLEAERMARPRVRRLPLAELTGRPMGGDRYAHGADFVAWVLADADRRSAFEAAVLDMAEAADTDLASRSEAFFGVGLDELSAAYERGD